MLAPVVGGQRLNFVSARCFSLGMVTKDRRAQARRRARELQKEEADRLARMTLLRFPSHNLVHLPIYYACGVLTRELGGFHQMPQPGFITKTQLRLYPFPFIEFVQLLVQEKAEIHALGVAGDIFHPLPAKLLDAYRNLPR